MNFYEYVKGLKRITLQDIKNIINEDLINENKPVYGFRDKLGILLFGELLYGGIPEPYVLMCENEDDLCQELYNLLQKEFLDNCEYSYEHSFSGEYEYLGIINNGEAMIYFPNYKPSHQSWIFKQVNSNNKKKRGL